MIFLHAVISLVSNDKIGLLHDWYRQCTVRETWEYDLGDVIPSPQIEGMTPVNYSTSIVFYQRFSIELPSPIQYGGILSISTIYILA
jgi:hypothetical protein